MSIASPKSTDSISTARWGVHLILSSAVGTTQWSENSATSLSRSSLTLYLHHGSGPNDREGRLSLSWAEPPVPFIPRPHRWQSWETWRSEFPPRWAPQGNPNQSLKDEMVGLLPTEPVWRGGPVNCQCCHIAGKADTTRKEKTAGQREDELRCTASHVSRGSHQIPPLLWRVGREVQFFYLFFSDTFP